MKLTRVVLRDYEAFYGEDGVLIYEGPLPDAVKILQALGHEVTEQVEPNYSVTAFRNEMPELIDVLLHHIKLHNKVK